MGDLINFHSEEEPSGLEPTVFDLAIVPDKVYCDNAVCPHCQTDEHPELYEGVEKMDAGHLLLLGDIMLCLECSLPYFVVEFPILESDTHVMTRWIVPERIFTRIESIKEEINK